MLRNTLLVDHTGRLSHDRLWLSHNRLLQHHHLLALGRLDFDSGEDVDQLTFGVNYELGRRTSKRRSLGNIFSSATGTFAGLTDF